MINLKHALRTRFKKCPVHQFWPHDPAEWENRDLIAEMTKWCETNLGPSGDSSWWNDEAIFVVVDANDALAFRLRFC